MNRRYPLGAVVLMLGVVTLGCSSHTPDSRNSPPATWSITLGGLGDEEGHDICQTADGRILIVGSRESATGSGSDLYAAIVSAHGEVTADTQLTLSGSSEACAVIPDENGGAVVAGRVDADVLFLKLDSMLRVSCLQQLESHSQYSEYSANDIVRISGGEYLLVGRWSHSQRPTPEEGGVLAIRTDASGFGLDELTYRGTMSHASANAAAPMSSGGYVVVGSTSSATISCDPGRPCDASDRLVSRLSDTPDTIWCRVLQGENGEAAYNVLALAEGFLVVGGNGNDVWLAEYSDSGQERWSRTLREPDHYDWALGVAATPDGGYVLVGSSRSLDWSDTDAILVKTDAHGSEVWRRRFGASGNDFGRAVVATADGGLMFVGSTSSFGSGGSDVWVVCTDLAGRVSGL